MFLRQVDRGREFQDFSRVSNQAVVGLLCNTWDSRKTICAAVRVYNDFSIKFLVYFQVFLPIEILQADMNGP